MNYYNNILSISLTLTVMLFFTACEEDKSVDPLGNWFKEHPFVSDPRTNKGRLLNLEPDKAFVSTPGEKVHFKVSRGIYPYSWGVADTDAGTIQPTDDQKRSEAIYTVKDPSIPNWVIVYDRRGYSAIGNIIPAMAEVLQIQPPSIDIAFTPAMNITFVAAGGIPPYKWYCTELYGTLSANTGESVKYQYNGTATTNAVETITVRDAAGSIAVANVNIGL